MRVCLWKPISLSLKFVLWLGFIPTILFIRHLSGCMESRRVSGGKTGKESNKADKFPMEDLTMGKYRERYPIYKIQAERYHKGMDTVPNFKWRK